MANFAGLSVSGRIATPDDSNWDEARAAWNLIADQHPEAVALVESADDVSKTVAFATENDLKVAPQVPGHGAPQLGPLEGTILIKTERMREVKVDGETARVEAGVLAEELGGAAHENGGQCFMPGSAPNVGVIGYTLGGGFGWLARKHGFACIRVRAIELVGADGEQRTVDAENGPDLFWGLRGGGGGYAVVTALHLDLLPVAEAYAGALLFAGEVGADGLRAYRDWTATVADEISSIARFMHLPPIPDVPEPLRDKDLLYVGAACIMGKEEGENAIAPLREIGEPLMDTFDQVPAPALSRIAMDPEPPVPGFGHHALLSELPDDAIDTLNQLTGPGSGSPLLLAELRHAGGAVGRAPQAAGALDKLDAAFTLYGVGLPMTPELGEAINVHLDKLTDAMKPWSSDGGYLNFAERPCDLDAILPADTCRRLADVKRKWDPDGRIVANHAVSLATA